MNERFPAEETVHAISAAAAAARLGSDATRGLDAGAAAERLARFGPNSLPEQAPTGALALIAAQFRDALVLLLLAAALVSALLGEWVDTAVIAAIVLLNATLGAVQEGRGSARVLVTATGGSARLPTGADSPVIEDSSSSSRLASSRRPSAGTRSPATSRITSPGTSSTAEIGERERQRWARELHDETLQGLAAIRISLATALQSELGDRPARLEAAAEATVDRLEGQINELSRLINDLRPASLERLGLAGALGALAEECSARGGFEIDADIDLDGSGLIGMRERVELLGGEIAIRSAPEQGARVSASVPLRSGG